MVASEVTGSLALVAIPFVFTQDELLTADEFLRKAKERGPNLSLDGLQRLHNHRMLVPLYRVSDTPVEGRRIEVAHDLWQNTRSRVLHAAAEGRLRDPADEGYSVAWPYRRPVDEDSRRWWNGFAFSSWQLMDVRAAINDYEFIQRGRLPHLAHPHRLRARQRNLVLSALATLYLPRVLGRVKMALGPEDDGLRRYRADADPQALIRRVGFDLGDLRREAEALLGEAHSDPLRKWLPLLRHASYAGWSKLSGEPLDFMWRRVAAEILLRAHEDLAGAGVLEPLPDITGQGWWTPLDDRLTVRHPEAQTLPPILEIPQSRSPKFPRQVGSVVGVDTTVWA